MEMILGFGCQIHAPSGKFEGNEMILNSDVKFIRIGDLKNMEMILELQVESCDPNEKP